MAQLTVPILAWNSFFFISKSVSEAYEAGV